MPCIFLDVTRTARVLVSPFAPHMSQGLGSGAIQKVTRTPNEARIAAILLSVEFKAATA